MLYLMMNKANDKYLVKIGMAKHPRERRAQYKGYNPTAIMRSTCAGTRKEEYRAHEKLASIGKRISGTEWFEVEKETFDELYEKGMGAIRPLQSPIHFLDEF